MRQPPPDRLPVTTGVKARRRWLRWLLEFAFVLALILAVNAWRTRDAPGGLAPGFSATLLDGTPVALADFRGSPVLLHFWATWCPVCGLEQGSIDALAEDYRVLTVAMDEAGADEILAYMQERQVEYPVIHDRDFAIARQYSIRAVPSSFILDTDGRIRFVETGYTTGIGLRLRLWWAGLQKPQRPDSGT
jgi:peroxiredoxin